MYSRVYSLLISYQFLLSYSVVSPAIKWVCFPFFLSTKQKLMCIPQFLLALANVCPHNFLMKIVWKWMADLSRMHELIRNYQQTCQYENTKWTYHVAVCKYHIINEFTSVQIQTTEQIGRAHV